VGGAREGDYVLFTTDMCRLFITAMLAIQTKSELLISFGG